MASVKLDELIYYGIHPHVVFPTYRVDHFVGFVCDDELLTHEVDYGDASYISFPIPDRTAPKLNELIEIIKYLDSLKGVIYLFCKGGHGRSGCVAAAFYGKKYNIDSDTALSYVGTEWVSQRDMTKIRPRIRRLGSPQTKVQINLVRTYLDELGKSV
jgi:hypothetical protein